MVAKTFNAKSVCIIKCTDAVRVETVFADHMFMTRIDQGNHLLLTRTICHIYDYFNQNRPQQCKLKLNDLSVSPTDLGQSFQLRSHVYNICRVFKLINVLTINSVIQRSSN
jgi:hypothetical protein